MGRPFSTPTAFRGDDMKQVRLSRTVPFLFVFSLSLGVMLLAPAWGSDWPRFRGVDGAGCRRTPVCRRLWCRRRPGCGRRPSRQATPPPSWWGAPLPDGPRGGRAGHAVPRRGHGKEMWRRAVEKAREETFNRLNGPTTPSPATDGENVYVFFPDFGLLSYDGEGRERWRTPLGPFTSIQRAGGLAGVRRRTDRRAGRHSGGGVPVGLLGGDRGATVASGAAHELPRVLRHARGLGSRGAGHADRGRGGGGADGVRRRDRDTALVGARPHPPPHRSPLRGRRLALRRGAGEGGGWPDFDGVVAQFDPDEDGRITIAHASEDPVWTRSFTGMDRHIGNGDGSDPKYAIASNEMIGGAWPGCGSGARGTRAPRPSPGHTKGMPSLSGALLYQGVLYVVRNAIVSTFDPENGRAAAPGAGATRPWATTTPRRWRATARSTWPAGAARCRCSARGATGRSSPCADLGEPIIASPALADGRVYVRTEGTLHCFGVDPPEPPAQ